MSLRQKQERFVLLVSKLIQFAYEEGFTLTFGEAWRTPEQAAWNQKHGKGLTNSLHCSRLAIDLNLFKDGIFLPDSTSHLPLGIFWEGLDPACRWGGRFSKPDGNHYSLTHDGRS